MPQLDFYHEVVRRALEKAGWRITSDPLRIGIDNLRVYIDLIAEQVVLADNGRFPIAVAIEVKSFEGKSAVNEFQKGLGQYLMYLEIIEEKGLDYTLYMAVTLDIYNAFFQKGIIQKLVRKYGVNLIVFDPTIEEIVAWEN
jgi:hypothetical protein